MNIIKNPTGTQDEIMAWFDAALEKFGKTFNNVLDYELYFDSKYPDTDADDYIRHEDYFLELLSSTGGYEGDRAYMDVILGIKHKSKDEYLGYLKFVGTYNSLGSSEWDNYLWDNYFPVKPVEVTVIQYNKY